MADIDNLKGGTKRGIGENTIDNLRGGTKRVYEENTINNLRGGTKRVILVGGGGGSAVIDPLNVTPSTSAQTITASGGVDGYSPVNVAAVDASIDANIQAGNIKKDVTILGVTGSYEGGGGSVTEPYLQKEVDGSGKLVSSTTTTRIIDLSGATDLSPYVLYQAYYNNTHITGKVDFSSLTNISSSGTSAMYQCFYGCTGITELDMSSLEYVAASIGIGQLCFGCTALTSADFSSLRGGGQNLLAYCFEGCTNFASIKLSSLKTLSSVSMLANAFKNTIIAELKFPALNTSSFGSRTNQFVNMLVGVTGCVVHFPSNIQSVIGSWADVTNGFGGTNTTVLFDLPATVVLTGANGDSYERNPKYDTGSALSWRINGSNVATTPYYTSGTTDPAVSDTIYSDAACTTPVTTIDSIA